MNKYEKHIRSICRRYKIGIIHTGKGHNGFCAEVDTRRIDIPKRIKTLRDYVCALHEIGHVLCESPVVEKHQHKYSWVESNAYRNPKQKHCFVTRWLLEGERDAWVMAACLAKYWNHSANKFLIYCIADYVVGYNHFHKEPFLRVPTKRLVMALPHILTDSQDTCELAEEFLLSPIQVQLRLSDYGD